MNNASARREPEHRLGPGRPAAAAESAGSACRPAGVHVVRRAARTGRPELALAKKPQVLLLNEPVAALDPLARRQFLTSLTDAVADQDLSVLLSSHLMHDLERVCDHLILLAASRTQLCGDIDDILASHRMLVGARRPLGETERGRNVIKATYTATQCRLIVRLDARVQDRRGRSARSAWRTSCWPTWDGTARISAAR